MNLIHIASILIFLVAIFLIATERFERVYVALLAAGAMFIIGAVDPREFLSFIDIEILGIIIGMMLVVNGAEKSGIFDNIAVRILRVSKGITSFAVILLIFTTLLSMVLNNIGAMLVSASITITMTKALKLRPQTILIFQAIIANLGGMTLLMSSIPNIIISIAGDITFNSFVINIAPLSILLFIITTLIFLRVFRQDTQLEINSILEKNNQKNGGEQLGYDEKVMQELKKSEFSNWIELAVNELGTGALSWRQNIAALILVATIVGFVVYDQFGLTPVFVALTGGVLMMIYSNDEPTEALREVDWSTAFFLAGLFTMINGMNNIGLIEQLSNAMLGIAGRWPSFLPVTVMWLSAIPSSVIDNIPLTATFAPIIRFWVSEGFSKNIWWGLVIGANLGGNLTPIGSPSNILVLAVSQREGNPISIQRFFLLSLPITLIQLTISMIYMYLAYIF